MSVTKTKKAALSSSTSTQWNVPDWRDAAAYPKPADLSDDLWRWEFLRRWNDYRKDWEAHFQGTYKYALACSKKTKYKYRLAHSKNSLQVLTPDHPQFVATGEYLLDKVKPGTEQEREAFKCIQAVRKYHLIGGLPNPANRNPFMLSFHSSFGGMYTGCGNFEEVRIQKDHVLYEFNLTRPIRPQVKKAIRVLFNEQLWRRKRKEGRRVHKRLFPSYLRVLDARGGGATYEQIGQMLLKLDDYDDAIKRAKDLHTQAIDLQANLSVYF